MNEKKQYLCPQIKLLIASNYRLMDSSPWVVGDDEVPYQGAKDGSIYGFEDNEDNYPNKVNVWK